MLVPPDKGIVELTHWLKANEHQPLHACVEQARARGFSQRVINAALQSYVVEKLHS